MGKRVLLVDDHQIFREALRGLLQRTPDIDVVGEASNAAEASALMSELKPDIVCMDIGLPGVNGIELTRQIKAGFPEVRIIVLSAYCDRIYVEDALRAGASAFVAKADGATELVYAMTTTVLDHPYLSSRVADRSSIGGGATQTSSGGHLLSDRERQVLALVSSGSSSKQIASRLGIAPGTVEVHRRNIMRKLNLHSAVELTRFAMADGLLQS